MSSLVSSLTPSCTTVSLGLGEVGREEAAALVREGVREALEDCRREGVVYPGVRGDRVWLHRGQVGGDTLTFQQYPLVTAHVQYD